MKNSFFHRNFFLIFCFAIIGCSSKQKSIFEFDFELLKKQGTEVFLENKKEKKNNPDSYVNKIILTKSTENFDWLQANGNYSNSKIYKNLPLKFNFLNKSKVSVDINKNNKAKRDLLYSDNKILLVDDSGVIFVFDESLNLLHKHSIYKKNIYENYLLKFSLVSDGVNAYISDNFGGLLAYDFKSNKIIWQNNFGVPFKSNLAIFKKNIYVTNTNGKLFSFDMSSGRQNWSYETGANNSKKDNAFKIAIFKNKILFSNDLSELICIDLEKNNLVWSFNLLKYGISNHTNLFQLSDIIINENNFYFSTSYGDILSFSLEDGRFRWSTKFNSLNTPVINGKYLISGNNIGEFLILNKNNGVIMHNDFLPNLSNSKNIKLSLDQIFISSNTVYFSANNGDVYYLDSKNLKDVKSKPMFDKIYSNIVIIRDFVFYIDSLGSVKKIS